MNDYPDFPFTQVDIDAMKEAFQTASQQTLTTSNQTITGGFHFYPPSNTCPGCGRCNHCGRSYQTQPYWHYSPNYFYQGPTSTGL